MVIPCDTIPIGEALIPVDTTVWEIFNLSDVAFHHKPGQSALRVVEDSKTLTGPEW